MANHKRKRPKNRRAGCLLCKPWKMNGFTRCLLLKRFSRDTETAILPILEEGHMVVRVIYEYQGKIPIVITVYFPFAQRYFGGGGFYEDKILA
jgi:hypothetical protein